jgi:hypothetical protein
MGDFVESADFKLVVVEPGQATGNNIAQNSSQSAGQNITQ